MQSCSRKTSYKPNARSVALSSLLVLATIGTAAGGKASKERKHGTHPKLPTKKFVLRKELATNPGGTLTLEADRGSIEVVPTDANRVAVEVIRGISKKYASEAEAILKHHEVVISRDGNNAVIRSRVKLISADRVAVDGLDFDVSQDVREAMKRAVQKRLKNIHFRVAIPREYSVKLKTGGQSITCGDLNGKVHCSTSGGGIKLGKIAGPVYAATSGGSLHLAAAADSVEMRTSGGSIRAGDIQGDAVAATSGGSISLGRVAGRVAAKTSGGSIRIVGAGGAVEAVTSGGSVSAAISRQPKADSYFATSGGTVSISLAKGLAFDIEHQGRGKASGLLFNKGTDGRARSAKLNGGGPKLITKGNVRFAYLSSK